MEKYQIDKEWKDLNIMRTYCKEKVLKYNNKRMALNKEICDLKRMHYIYYYGKISSKVNSSLKDYMRSFFSVREKEKLLDEEFEALKELEKNYQEQKHKYFNNLEEYEKKKFKNEILEVVPKFNSFDSGAQQSEWKFFILKRTEKFYKSLKLEKTKKELNISIYDLYRDITRECTLNYEEEKSEYLKKFDEKANNLI